MNVSLMSYSPLSAGHLTRPEWNSNSIRSKTDRAAMEKYDSAQEQDMEIVRFPGVVRVLAFEIYE